MHPPDDFLNLRSAETAAVDDHFPDPAVKSAFGQQLFQRQVHAVAPVMLRVGGHVDPRFIRIWPAQGFVCAT